MPSVRWKEAHKARLAAKHAADRIAEQNRVEAAARLKASAALRVFAWLPYPVVGRRTTATAAWHVASGSGVPATWLARQTGIPLAEVEAALAQLVAEGRAIRVASTDPRQGRAARYFAARPTTRPSSRSLEAP